MVTLDGPSPAVTPDDVGFMLLVGFGEGNWGCIGPLLNEVFPTSVAPRRSASFTTPRAACSPGAGHHQLGRDANVIRRWHRPCVPSRRWRARRSDAS
jgi:hypothetical protein